MRIRMYNVGFGDCFCIRDRKSSLLVDFGAANSKIEGRPRREVFDVIISDLTTIRKKNLLLTHFHPDHVSGLLYMMRYRRDAYEFEKIYLPDVFSDPEMKYTLTLLLLADVTKKASLPGRRVSLFALAEALCARKVKIDLLSRGSKFEGKYTALWPDVRTVSSETEDVFNSLIENNEKAMTELVNIAEEVRQLFMSMTEDENEADVNLGEEKEVVDAAGKQTDSDSAGSVQGNNGTQEYAQAELRHRLKPEKLEKKFRELQATAEFQALLECAEKQGHLLRQFRHKISLAFQNTRDGELNLLFTGDVQPRYMKMIVEDYDGRIPLHEHYWCIKVPHHGTESHFFDFSRFSPENMMIPNGAYYDNSKKKSKNQRTSMQYGGLFYINDAHMYCSNCDCCDSYENGCSCREYDVISPSYYKDI
ncbi:MULTISPECIES: MBL fold metallo-hydrolase [Blautia]|uniref:MBL fold metallo-hydrolase n=1 Tax=Blautia TaxID=572511 RepID=UPI001D0256AC|nr:MULTISPECIES: MBL fold metallo-hydrolase [Blautia]MCB5473284.1 MBL fold metallo-hydrolase [Blautia luti]NSK75920.1 MBL fold metallo-hydrolase [Blautia massiliensis (ex Durand et al. 2017)]